MKKCNRCKEEKELSEFNKNKWAKDGHEYHCRDCGKEKGKSYYSRNKEKVAARIQGYKVKDIEHFKEINNKYYARNSEHVKQQQKIYRTENKELIAQRLKDQIDNLGDRYLKHILKKQLKLTGVPPEMIEAKRNLIRVQRALGYRQ